jgi:hypothetical protein
MCAALMVMMPVGSQRRDGGVLAAWAEGLAGRRDGARGRGCPRFVFYRRVSTEDWQDPESSRVRQLAQAVMLDNAAARSNASTSCRSGRTHDPRPPRRARGEQAAWRIGFS